MFPENGRTYGYKSAIYPADIDPQRIDFSYSKYNTIRRWGYKTQRTISFCVMKTEGEFTVVHIKVDILGWYLWNKWKLGGMG